VLIDAAVDDLEIIELDEKYIVNMDEYYRHGGGQCEVCLAGSVMACCTIDLPPAFSLFPMHYHPIVKRKLWSLNQFRQGGLESGLKLMMISVDDYKFPKRVKVVDYSCDPQQCKADMRALAETLREIKL